MDKMIAADLTRAGIDPSAYDARTAWLIVEPSYAPENFYMDGEIAPRTALSNWLGRLRRAGVSEADVRRARRNFA
jgi:hypothetical protein